MKETYICERDLYMRKQTQNWVFYCRYKVAKMHQTRKETYICEKRPKTGFSIADTRWRRYIGRLKLQVSFCKRATKYWALLAENNLEL